MTHQLNFPWEYIYQWHQFTIALNSYHVLIKEREEFVIWAHYPIEEYTPKSSYIFLIDDKKPKNISWWWKKLWKIECPAKARLY